MTPIAVFFTNALPFIVMGAIALATYGLMFVAKKPILVCAGLLVKATASSRVTTATNSVAGTLGCECISVGLLYITEFLFSYHISGWWGIGAGLLATLIYLFVENIQDASHKKLGVAIDEYTPDDVTSDSILEEIRKAIAKAKAEDEAKVDAKSTVTGKNIISSIDSIAKN